MNPIDHAKLLLVMASKDMKALDIMIMPESVDDEILIKGGQLPVNIFPPRPQISD